MAPEVRFSHVKLFLASQYWDKDPRFSSKGPSTYCKPIFAVFYMRERLVSVLYFMRKNAFKDILAVFFICKTHIPMNIAEIKHSQIKDSLQ